LESSLTDKPGREEVKLTSDKYVNQLHREVVNSRLSKLEGRFFGLAEALGWEEYSIPAESGWRKKKGHK